MQGIVLVLIFSLFAPTVSLKPLSIETPSVLAANRSVKTIASGTKYATSLYVIKSGVRGPVVMVVGEHMVMSLQDTRQLISLKTTQ